MQREWYLGLETAGPEGSAALALRRDLDGGEWWEWERWVVRSVGVGEEQAAGLVPSVEILLREEGVAPEELAGIVVGGGPGSFTGLRVAAATAKAWAWSLGIPLYAVSSLEGAALAQWAAEPLCVLFDARGDRVYGGAYRRQGRSWETLLPPTPATLAQVLHMDLPRATVFAGPGALRHRIQIEGEGWRVLAPPWGFPSAMGLLRRFELEPLPSSLASPGLWEPEYLRPPAVRPPGKGRGRGPPV